MNRQQQIERFLLAAHRLVAARLREDPRKVDQLVATLKHWRERDGATRSDPYWDEWSKLLAEGPAAIESATCVESDHAAVLRSVSPIGVLISASERSSLLASARAP